MKIFARVLDYLSGHRRGIALIAAGLMLVGLVAIASNYIWIGQYGKYIRTVQDLPQESLVGVVLGGGVRDGKPLLQLRGRLDAAAELVNAGKVSMLVVSGDNRFASYDEPGVMRDYLVKQKGITPSKVQEDYAGRSTYETCERTAKVFGIRRAVFISESTHLPRVLYSCRHFGIEAYGYSSDSKTELGFMLGQRWREIFARTKATINHYIIGEKTVLGEKVDIE